MYICYIKCSILVHFSRFNPNKTNTHSLSVVLPVPDVEDGAVADDADEPNDGIEQSHGHHRPVAGGSELGPVAGNHLDRHMVTQCHYYGFLGVKNKLRKPLLQPSFL